MVARLTPRVDAMVLADSPLACIRCATAAFSSFSAFGRPMDCPRARRASRAAVEDEASTELKEARSNAFGRNGDPSDAWDHSIKALEDLLIPIVVPNQAKPNLGHVVGQLRNQGQLWKLVLPVKDRDHDVFPLVGKLDLVWPTTTNTAAGRPRSGRRRLRRRVPS
ncbi:MAG: hypothetical protein JWR11_2642 [Mycobacterium sp.]|jgi:hypothetical protein|nr:hypothetical protein [Mycobacterium sp.]